MTGPEFHPYIVSRLEKLDRDPEVAKAELEQLHDEIGVAGRRLVDAMLDKLNEVREAGDEDAAQEILALLRKYPGE